MATMFMRGKTYYSKLMMNGEEVRKPLSTNKKIAEELLGNLVKKRNALRNGHAPENISWRAFKGEVLKSSEAEKKLRTIQAEKRAFREMENYIPVDKIDRITPQLLDELKSKWLEAGRGKYVINRDLRSIRTAMKKAERYGYVAHQDWTTNKYIKVPKGRLHYFTVADLKKIKAVCHGIWLTVLYLGARAGLRREEIRELTWNEVDFVRQRIHVAPNENWTPKDYERRFIPMPKDLSKYLTSIKQRQQYVFQDKDGSRPSLGSMTTYFSRLVRKAKLAGSVHTLRHTFAAHYVQSGGDVYRLKEYLGHSSIETTQVYAHLSPDNEDRTIQSHLPQF